ncbi:LppA family lipoprotein [Amycolatopsis suaedae]|uniref:Uncharacterized protein n=1 Tax=Amycolatopsis suaedae TaxID=2510978 RepID=A0A4Q7JD89_9PSEU|nr:LppA family lipoprotein [Amycolatopsis suaedae]RZQ65118.1 hypothetical protein EWH70_04265 [Amycolatopsis suaedae]
MPYRNRGLAITALTLVATLTVGCGNSADRYFGNETSKNTMPSQEQFQQLMSRPTVEEAAASNEEMLRQLRERLSAELNVKPWIEKPDTASNYGGCMQEFSEVHGWDATIIGSSLWSTEAALSGADWQRGKQIAKEIGAQFGFTKVAQESDQQTDLWLRDDFGAELKFGSGNRTAVSVTTGCHLYAEAKKRGTPRQGSTTATPPPT